MHRPRAAVHRGKPQQQVGDRLGDVERLPRRHQRRTSSRQPSAQGCDQRRVYCARKAANEALDAVKKAVHEMRLVYC
jgi:hypothetical protein